MHRDPALSEPDAHRLQATADRRGLLVRRPRGRLRYPRQAARARRLRRPLRRDWPPRVDVHAESYCKCVAFAPWLRQRHEPAGGCLMTTRWKLWVGASALAMA